MTAKDYLAVCGTVNLDTVLRLPRLPVSDEAVPVLERYRTMGGTAANTAYGAACLGVDVSLVGETGADFLAEFGPALEGAGVGLIGLAEVEPGPRCQVLLAEDGSQSYLVEPGAVADWGSRLSGARLETIAGLAQHYHLGTGHPDFYIRLVETLEGRKGVTVALDPAQELAYHYDESTLRGLLPYADLFFCSAFELGLARKLLGLPKGERGAAEVLQSLGPHTVVVTKGGEGSTIYSRVEMVMVPALAPEQKGGTPTGAGDGYRAGFYAARHLGLDLAEQGLAGAAVASFVLEAREPVAAGLSWERVAERMEGVVAPTGF